MAFIPSSFETFTFVSNRFDEASSTARFVYHLGSQFEFCEEICFHGARTQLNDEEREALSIALDHLHLALGISYYKAAVPPDIRVLTRRLPQRTAEFFSNLYEKGLAEFAFKNGLKLSGKIDFPSASDATPEPSRLTLPRHTVVPLGGGKDSLVTVELLRGIEPKLSTLTMGEFKIIDELVEEIALPHIRVTRTLDPGLMHLNEEGAYNGHVPFSAILAFLMPVGAILYGFDTVVMSQERSASSGNLLVDGGEVNHQYSKSFEFEQQFAKFVNDAVLAEFKYFSLLRPLSELAIAKRFSGLTRYHGLFTSCNRAFRLRGAQTVRWCGNCPKCRFVFLALAPFLEKGALLNIFGKNLLSDAAQVPGFRELAGLQGHKPFECVGEVEECQLAFRLIGEKPEWENEVVVKWLLADIYGHSAEHDRQILESSSEHIIPAAYAGVLDAAR